MIVTKNHLRIALGLVLINSLPRDTSIHDHVNNVRHQLARKQAGLTGQSDPEPQSAKGDDLDADVEVGTQPIGYGDGEEETIDQAGDEPDQIQLDPEPATELAKDSDQEEEQSTQDSDEPSTQNSDELSADLCAPSATQPAPSQNLSRLNPSQEALLAIAESLSPATYAAFCAHVNALGRRSDPTQTLISLLAALATELGSTASQFNGGSKGRRRKGGEAIEAVEELLSWALTEWDKQTARSAVEDVVARLLLAALSLIPTPTPPPPTGSHTPNPISVGPAALALTLSVLPTFPPSPRTCDSALADFPRHAAVALRRAFGEAGEAEERLVCLSEELERLGELGEAAEGELVEAIAEGEVEDGSEVERRVLQVLTKGEGVAGLLDGLDGLEG